VPSGSETGEVGVNGDLVFELGNVTVVVAIGNSKPEGGTVVGSEAEAGDSDAGEGNDASAW
jgi:hypothetical protein